MSIDYLNVQVTGLPTVIQGSDKVFFSQDTTQHAALERRRSRNSSSSSVFSLSDTMTKSMPTGGTAVLEELQATIRHKEGELTSMQVGGWGRVLSDQ